MKLLYPAPSIEQSLFPDLVSPEVLAERLHETAGDWLAEARLDRTQSLVRDVALLGPESRNGYRYTAEAMQQAAPLYDGRPVFVDHPEATRGLTPHGSPSSPGSPLQRSIRDYAGKVTNPRFEGNRVRGDLHLLGPNTDWLMQLVESAPGDIGMSHVVLARRNPGGDAVEHIERVISVDIVAFPATTQSFQEADTSAASGRCEPAGTGNSPRLDQVPRGSPHPLASDLHQLIEQSRLPAFARSPALVELLQACPDPRRLLTALEAYWRQALAEAPRSVEKIVGTGPVITTHARRALIAAIRGR